MLSTGTSLLAGKNLHTFTGRGHASVIRVLLSHGAQPTLPALSAAAQGGHADAVRELVGDSDSGRYTISQLERASESALNAGHTAVVELLTSMVNTRRAAGPVQDVV